MRPVRLLARARGDAERIDAWWGENRLAAPALFLDELEAALRDIAQQPDAAPIFGRRASTAKPLWTGH